MGPGGVGYTVLPLSICPSKICFVAFFSVTVDGRNLIFGHKLHIGSPYGGKRCSTQTEGRTDGRTVVKQYTPSPLGGIVQRTIILK
jgi:hypothetical protein